MKPRNVPASVHLTQATQMPERTKEQKGRGKSLPFALEAYATASYKFITTNDYSEPRHSTCTLSSAMTTSTDSPDITMSLARLPLSCSTLRPRTILQVLQSSAAISTPM